MARVVLESRTIQQVEDQRAVDGPNRDGQPSPNRPEGLTVVGTVAEAMPNAMWAVRLDNGQRITAHIAGVDRTRLVRVVPGDRVTVQLSPYDLTRGRITQRHR